MAEISQAVWMKQSMEAAMKLLDARARQASAQADVETAEREVARLTGRTSSIDLNAHSYSKYFECEGLMPRAVLEDMRQEAGGEPRKAEPCKNIVTIDSWDEEAKNPAIPKLCDSCERAIEEAKPPKQKLEDHKAKNEEKAKLKIAEPPPPAPAQTAGDDF